MIELNRLRPEQVVGAVELVRSGKVLTIANEVISDPDNGVADCAEDGQYALLYVAAPLTVAKAAGTPVNPVVIK
ncbi:hypothetical protein [Blastococcus sp. SYSU DS0973]